MTTTASAQNQDATPQTINICQAYNEYKAIILKSSFQFIQDAAASQDMDKINYGAVMAMTTLAPHIQGRKEHEMNKPVYSLLADAVMPRGKFDAPCHLTLNISEAEYNKAKEKLKASYQVTVAAVPEQNSLSLKDRNAVLEEQHRVSKRTAQPA